MDISITTLLLIVSFLTFFWLGALTFLLFNLKKHYNSLTKKTNKQDLQDILSELLKFQKNQGETVANLKKEIEAVEKDGQFHLQHVGFKRFNPFGDTGGDQSFALSLLDNHKNGIVLSCLHSREATRVYAKEVDGGKGKEFPLSTEEKEVITSAQPAKS